MAALSLLHSFSSPAASKLWASVMALFARGERTDWAFNVRTGESNVVILYILSPLGTSCLSNIWSGGEMGMNTSLLVVPVDSPETTDLPVELTLPPEMLLEAEAALEEARLSLSNDFI